MIDRIFYDSLVSLFLENNLSNIILGPLASFIILGIDEVCLNYAKELGSLSFVTRIELFTNLLILLRFR